MLDQIEHWAELSASAAMLETLKTVTGLLFERRTAACALAEAPPGESLSGLTPRRSPGDAIRGVRLPESHRYSEQLAGANAARVEARRRDAPAPVGAVPQRARQGDEEVPGGRDRRVGADARQPAVLLRAPLPDLVFVVAHELMHLADTFGRSGNADPYLVNVAHDYVINDILSTELGREVPLGGWCGTARQESLEAIVADLACRGHGSNPDGCWSVARKKKPKRAKKPKTAMQEELERAGLLSPEADEPEAQDDDDPDNYPAATPSPRSREAELEPELGPKERSAQARRRAARSRPRVKPATAPCGDGEGRRKRLRRRRWRGDPHAGRGRRDCVSAAGGNPALQHWLDAVAPGPRSYSRPSRRGADRDDGIILAGRKREGWGAARGAGHERFDGLTRCRTFWACWPPSAKAAGVDQVHVMQCDVGVTSDEWLDPAELMSYKVTGFGGSDMSPAMDESRRRPRGERGARPHGRLHRLPAGGAAVQRAVGLGRWRPELPPAVRHRGACADLGRAVRERARAPAEAALAGTTSAGLRRAVRQDLRHQL